MVNKKLFYIFAIAMMFVTGASNVLGQNPQTQTAPIYSVNAKYANGTAPGYAPTPGTGLVLNLGAGTANCSGTIATYAGGTFSLTASATNYIYLNTSASCAPAVKTSVFTVSDIPLAVVVTGLSTISSITDVRTMFSPSGGSTGSVSGQTSNTLPLATSPSAIGASSGITQTGSGISQVDTFPGTVASVNGVSKLPEVNVLHPAFAADNSGATDASVAINSAITYALSQAVNGVSPIVRIPYGTYLFVSGPLLENTPGLDVECDEGAVLKYGTDFVNSPGVYGLVAMNASNTTLHGCTIDGGGIIGTATVVSDSASGGVATINYSGLTGPAIASGTRRVLFIGCTNTGGTATLSNVSTQRPVFLVQSLGSGSFTVTAPAGMGTFSTTAESSCVAEFYYGGNGIAANYGSSVGSPISGVNLSGNIIQNIGRYGLDVENVNYSNILNNTLNHVQGHAVQTIGITNNVLIANNNCNQTGPEDGECFAVYSAPSGLQNGVILSNNASAVTKGFAIEVGPFGGNYPRNTTISHNTCQMVPVGATALPHLEGCYSLSGTTLTVVGNSCENLTGNNNNQIGCLELVQFDHSSVIGNSLVGGRISFNSSQHDVISGNHIVTLNDTIAINAQVANGNIDVSYNNIVGNLIEKGPLCSTSNCWASIMGAYFTATGTGYKVAAGYVLNDGTTNCAGGPCLEYAINNGIATASTTPPTWSSTVPTQTAFGGTTTDGTVIWQNVGPVTSGAYVSIRQYCNGIGAHCDHNLYSGNIITGDSKVGDIAIQIQGSGSAIDDVLSNNLFTAWDTCYSITDILPSGILTEWNDEAGCSTIGISNMTYVGLFGPFAVPSFALNGGVAMTANQGNGIKVQHSTGTTTNGDVVIYDSNGNAVDSGTNAIGGLPAVYTFKNCGTAGADCTSQTASITSHTMVASVGGNGGHFIFSGSVAQTALGTGCTVESVAPQLSWTNMDNSISNSPLMPVALNNASTGGGNTTPAFAISSGSIASGQPNIGRWQYEFDAKGGTAINFGTVYVNTNCSVNWTYTIRPVLSEVIQY